MIVKTSTKNETKVKKVTLDENLFLEEVKIRVHSLCCDYAMKNGITSLDDVSAKIKGQFEKQVKAEIQSKFKIKGSRSGHLDYASAEQQAVIADANESIKNITFSYDGYDKEGNKVKKTIACAVITKVVNEEPVK